MQYFCTKLLTMRSTVPTCCLESILMYHLCRTTRKHVLVYVDHDKTNYVLCTFTDTIGSGVLNLSKIKYLDV